MMARSRGRTGFLVFEFARDRSGLAAVEFAMIVPLMLVLFLGMVEFSTGVAVDRKVTLVARTLSDLTSQTTSSVDDAALTTYFAASASILTPYDVTPVNPTISEIYVDKNGVAKIQWSKSATVGSSGGSPVVTLQASGHNAGDVVSIPSSIAIPDSWLIWSEVNYNYKPGFRYMISSAGITLHDESYTRPRYTPCVDYPPPSSQTNACIPK